MKHMADVGIRALKQNASAVVARAESGEVVTVTDRGRPVAQMTALAASPLQRAIDAGRARPPLHSLATLSAPESGGDISGALGAMRDGERY